MRFLYAVFTCVESDRLRFCGLNENVSLPLRHFESARSGMPSLVAVDQAGYVQSLYCVRQDGKPEQVWGIKDDLLDSRQVEDRMAPCLPVYRMCRHLLGALYDAFHIREMLEYEPMLRRIEELALQKSLLQEADWKTCRAIVAEACRQMLTSTPLLERALVQIDKVSAPRKNQLSEPIAIDLLGYPAGQH